MENAGESARIQKMKSVKAQLVDIPWVDSSNNTDCGIYVMRHMETFMGDCSTKWKSGLKKGNKRQMQYLRIKYCAAIVGAENNKWKNKNIDDANSYCTASSEKEPIHIESILLSNKDLNKKK